MTLIVSDRYSLIIGLGVTGFSCAQYLERQGERFCVVDSRQDPPFLQQLKSEQPDTLIHLGDFALDLCLNASQIILSPGVSLQEPVLVEATKAGVPIRSDIDLFAQAARKACVPIVAITGSNAKSTVTSLVGEMAKIANLNVAIGGNLGVPSVSLLDADIDLYVMELSSFQLESTTGLGASVACVLNVSPDHMDRYHNLMRYHQAKHRIFQACKAAVVNADDALTNPLVPDTVTQTRFSLGEPDVGQFGVLTKNGEKWLAKGTQCIIPVHQMSLNGGHNIANGLAALAIGEASGLPMDAMIRALTTFTGLPHRCEHVTNIDGVSYINDSKGTNVGATVAAIEGLGPDLTGKIILIAGGVGKGADFSDLSIPVSKYCKQILLIGADAQKIEKVLVDKALSIHAKDMSTAVSMAHANAVSGDLVLLSPACASFDSYDGFEARGRHFSQLVRALL
ncbi:MAG: UDP-N-acetylmuramoyl-L-alanine--D-glutamate ligase [Oceanospirillaceae bacterium]|nr:UDP-N-acetylmuramoyl-L-alanine--D-glutamate ligase [Oceanospirillaceae bacterium]